MDTASGTQVFTAVLLVALASYYVPTIYKSAINNHKLSYFPTVGCSGLFTSYIGAWRFSRHGMKIVQEGYDKYRGSIFKVPTLSQWLIIVSGADKVDDIRRATEDFLSFRRAIRDFLRVDLTFGAGSVEDLSLVNAIRTPLTRNIANRFPEIRDETIAAFADCIPAKNDEWVKFTAFPTLMDIVCRVSNRMLIGLPLCRNHDFLTTIKRFTTDAVKANHLLSLVPPFLKSTVIRFTALADDIERTMNHIEPLLKERLEQEAKYGEDWPERPNDMITWLFEVSGENRKTLESTAMQILSANFASIHSTTVTLTNALFDLAARPEYVQPLREEVEKVVNAEGWSKKSIAKFEKVDSFIKESMRLSPINIVNLLRKVVKDFTFSDGTRIPAGNIICVPAASIQIDSDIYTDPGTFDGFRFEKMRKQEGEGAKHALVSLDLDYLLFGHGRHACPGRFFAANGIKAMMAHILLNYDVKLANGGRPANIWLGRASLPNPKAELLFRKRA